MVMIQKVKDLHRYRCQGCGEDEDLVKIRIDMDDPPLEAIWCKICGLMWTSLPHPRR